MTKIISRSTGPLSLADSVDQVKRFQACNWNAVRIDGHDQAAILRAIRKAQKSEKPSLIACKTIIGFGMPTRAGTSKAHSDAPGAEEIAGARRNLNWPYEPFVIPGADSGRLAQGGQTGTHAAAKLGSPALQTSADRTSGRSSSAVCAAICLPLSARWWTDLKRKLAEDPAAHRHPQGIPRRA